MPSNMMASCACKVGVARGVVTRQSSVSLSVCVSRGVSVAGPGADWSGGERLPTTVSCCQIRLHHHPHLHHRPDRLCTGQQEQGVFSAPGKEACNQTGRGH